MMRCKPALAQRCLCGFWWALQREGGLSVGRKTWKADRQRRVYSRERERVAFFSRSTTPPRAAGDPLLSFGIAENTW